MTATIEQKRETLWVIYDGRYHHDSDRASIAEVCGSRAEAKQALKHWPSDYVAVETEVVKK